MVEHLVDVVKIVVTGAEALAETVGRTRGSNEAITDAEVVV